MSILGGGLLGDLPLGVVDAGGTSIIEISVIEEVGVSDSLLLVKPLLISETMIVSDIAGLYYYIVLGIIERLSAVEIARPQITSNDSITETIFSSDEIKIIKYLILTETISASDSNFITQLIAIIEQISLSDELSNKMIFSNSIVESLKLVDTIFLGKLLSIVENLTTNDLVDYIVKLTEVINETLTVTEIEDHTFHLVSIVTDGFSVTDEIESKAIFNLNIEEVISTFGEIVIDNEHYTFVMNAKTKGVSEYTNYNFNSMSDGLAANDNGIYRLTGADDAGTQIDAFIKTGLIDFGSGMHKQVPYAYIGMNKSGNMILKTIVDHNGNRKERWYKVTPKRLDSTDTIRVQMGKGVKSRYWQFELSNKDGDDFEIDSIEFLPMILNRRV